MLCTTPDLLACISGYSMLVLLQSVTTRLSATQQCGMLCTTPDLLACSADYSMLVLLQTVKAWLSTAPQLLCTMPVPLNSIVATPSCQGKSQRAPYLCGEQQFCLFVSISISINIKCTRARTALGSKPNEALSGIHITP